MARSVLDAAASLARRGKHAAVIALLEPNLPLFRDSHRYYYLLGAACVRTGDMGGAATYLRRAEQLEPRDLDTKLCLAALHVRRGESDKALALYLRVIEDRPKDAVAARAMALLRGPDFHERLGSLVGGRALERLLPRPRGLPAWLLPAGIALLSLAVLALSAPLIARGLDALAEARAPRPDIAAVSLSEGERAAPIALATGTARYILTEKEAIAAFNRAKERFQEYRDNAALVEINRLADSNAAEGLRQKAETLRAYVQAPDWATLRDVPDFAEVSADPRLFRGCAVIWKGRAANLREGEARGFDFLAGYADRSRLDGIVPVVVAPSLRVPLDQAFELLARVRPTNQGFELEALALHELVAP